MSRHIFVIACLITMVGVSTGCRNSSYCNPCGNNVGAFQNTQTLPSPPTYSLQIPSLSQNNNGQAYYNPNSTARQPSYLLNPNAAAPTPAGSNLGNQPGWRAVGSEGNTTNGGQGVPRSVLQQNETSSTPTQRSSTTLAQVQPPGATGIRTASTSSGLSFKDSVNYRTTSTDERLDRTRLPATDASSVRAPSGMNTVTTGTRMAQLNPGFGVTSTQPVYSGQPRLANNTGPFLLPQTYAQTQVIQPAQPTPIVGSYQSGVPRGFNGVPQPYTIQGSYTAPVAQPGILSQSTAVYDPQNSQNFSNGWRDRELTARR